MGPLSGLDTQKFALELSFFQVWTQKGAVCKPLLCYFSSFHPLAECYRVRRSVNLIPLGLYLFMIDSVVLIRLSTHIHQVISHIDSRFGNLRQVGMLKLIFVNSLLHFGIQ